MNLMFDIETGPLPDRELMAMCPEWQPTEFPGGEAFDPSAVKTGNMSDPKKIEAKIAKERAAWEKAKSDHAKQQAEDETNHFERFKDRAALDPVTGCVVVIGIHDISTNAFEAITGPLEDMMLAEWWKLYQQVSQRRGQLVGVNIFKFDLPFLVRRSWILGVKVPADVVDLSSKWCNWSRVFRDVRTAWQLGDNQVESNFQHLAKVFKTDGKHDGMSGKDFARAWSEDRDAALKYLEQDVAQPAVWARRMGLIG